MIFLNAFYSWLAVILFMISLMSLLGMFATQDKVFRIGLFILALLANYIFWILVQFVKL